MVGARWLLIGLLAPVPLLLIGALLTQDAKHIADTDAAPATTRGDSARGKVIAATCVECHGGDGISASAAAPNLAGLSERAIAKQLVDYRRGARAGKSMQQASARLSAFCLTASTACGTTQRRPSRASRPGP